RRGCTVCSEAVPLRRVIKSFQARHAAVFAGPLIGPVCEASSGVVPETHMFDSTRLFSRLTSWRISSSGALSSKRPAPRASNSLRARSFRRPLVMLLGAALLATSAISITANADVGQLAARLAKLRAEVEQLSADL